MATIYRAHKEWTNRPDDQRFLSMAELQAAVLQRREESFEIQTPVKEIGVVVRGEGEERDIAFEANGELLIPTNWSFGQVCNIAQAPAQYLQRIDPTLAAINLQYGLRNDPMRSNAMILAQRNGDTSIRCLTSPNYGRIWDSEVVDVVQRVNDDGRWVIPSASYAHSDPLRATTLYASDRDVFIFLVDPINTIEFNGQQLFRGFYTWNSEVGDKTFGLCTFLYNYICDNRIIWGAENVKEVRVRHSWNAPGLFEKEGRRFLNDYASSKTKEIIDGITSAQRKALPVGKDETVVDWLRVKGFTKGEAEGAVTRALLEEGKCETVWDVVQGLTAHAREIVYTDKRCDLETRAGKLMALAV